jgi:hypothetical protein
MQRYGSQLAVLFGGVRYGYYRWARSRQTPFRTTQRFLVAADLLVRPLNELPADLQNVRGKTIEQSPVGGRVALQFPGFQREPDSLYISFNLTLGYLPAPSDLIALASMALF